MSYEHPQSCINQGQNNLYFITVSIIKLRRKSVYQFHPLDYPLVKTEKNIKGVQTAFSVFATHYILKRNCKLAL